VQSSDSQAVQQTCAQSHDFDASMSGIGIEWGYQMDKCSRSRMKKGIIPGKSQKFPKDMGGCSDLLIETLAGLL